MNKCVYKGVDIFNPLDKNLKHFIDAFASVYGEQHRAVITKRLSNAIYFFLGGDFHTVINYYKERMAEEIEKVNTYKIPESLKQTKLNEIKKRYEFIINVFDTAIKKSQQISLQHECYRQQLILDKINNIRTHNILEELQKDNSRLCSTYSEILSTGRSQFIINSYLYSNDRKQTYYELFKSLGYPVYGFEDCLMQANCLDEVFDSKLIEQLDKDQQQQEQEIANSNFCITDFQKTFKELNIYDDDSTYFDLAKQYISGTSPNAAFVIPCLSYKTGFTSLCFCKNALSLTLEDLAHEMGHIIDLFVVESSSEGYYYKCGFDVHYKSLTPEYKKMTKYLDVDSKYYHAFTLFNEMTNEFICQQVAKEVEKKGKIIVFGKRKAHTQNSYEFGFEIFEDFLKKYQKQLIEFKLTIDKNERAFDYFGEKNLLRLAILAKNYITKRQELNTRLLAGDRTAQEELTVYKKVSRAELSMIESRIEKHIQKQTPFTRNRQNGTSATLYA